MATRCIYALRRVDRCLQPCTLLYGGGKPSSLDSKALHLGGGTMCVRAARGEESTALKQKVLPTKWKDLLWAGELLVAAHHRAWHGSLRRSSTHTRACSCQELEAYGAGLILPLTASPSSAVPHGLALACQQHPVARSLSLGT